MASQVFVYLAVLVFGFTSRSRATTYTVGDSSGWDISTNIDSWAQDKHFVIGDVLSFQYSSSHSVEEVDREGYQGCNTTNVLLPSSNGNTTFALTKPGNRYFICGNKLHCYAGMKLHVFVDGKAEAGLATGAPTADGPTAGAPAAAPSGDTSTIPTTTTTTIPSSKTNNPSSVVPNSAVFVPIGFKSFAFVGFTCLLSWII